MTSSQGQAYSTAPIDSIEARWHADIAEYVITGYADCYPRTNIHLPADLARELWEQLGTALAEKATQNVKPTTNGEPK